MKTILLTMTLTLLTVSGGVHYLVYEGKIAIRPAEHAYTQADREDMDKLIAKNSAADVFGERLPGSK